MQVSYSTYLWHWPLLVVMGAAFGPLDRSIPIVLLAIGLAALTQRFVEEPFREGFAIGRRPRVNVGQALTASLAVVIACAGTAVLARDMSKARLGDLAAQLDGLDHYQTGALCRMESVPMSRRCVHGDPDSDTTIVLLGDSMAGQWFGAVEDIATRRGWRLVSLVRPACPAVAIDKIDKKTGRLDTDCSDWRELAFERIQAEAPETVLVANHRTEPVVDGVSVKRLDERLLVWEAGLQETLRRLTESNSDIVYFGDAPSGDDPAECITTHRDELDACDRNLTWLLPWYEVERPAVVAAGAAFFDTTDRLCEDGACPVVVDGLIAYRDNVHLSSRYATSLAPEIEAFMSSGRLALGESHSVGASPAGKASEPISPVPRNGPRADALLSDTFSRDVETGWGRPEIGSHWVQPRHAAQASAVSVGAGSMTLTRPSEGVSSKVLVGSRDIDTTFRWSMDNLPTSEPVVVYAGPRVIDGTGFYRLYATVTPDAGITAWFAARADGEGGSIGERARPGIAVAPGEWVWMRAQAIGAEPTLLRARLWKDGEEEPATWQLEVEDRTAGLQVEGDQASATKARFGVYTGSEQSRLPLRVRFDDILISALEPSALPEP